MPAAASETVTSSARAISPASSASSVSRIVISFVRLAAGRCSSAFFSRITVPLRASRSSTETASASMGSSLSRGSPCAGAVSACVVALSARAAAGKSSSSAASNAATHRFFMQNPSRLLHR